MICAFLAQTGMATGGIAWPNMLKVIGETQVHGTAYILKKLHGFLPLVIAGFAGLVIAAVWQRYLRFPVRQSAG